MAHRQPVHRRPSWAQRDKSYEHYLRKNLAINRSPGRDYGYGSFSYDETHLSMWQLPAALAEQIPSTLRTSVDDWAYAGAAVCTALDRIGRLANDAVERAHPDKSTHRWLARESSSSASPASTPVSTPEVEAASSPAVTVPTSPGSLPISPGTLSPQRGRQPARLSPLSVGSSCATTLDLSRPPPLPPPNSPLPSPIRSQTQSNSDNSQGSLIMSILDPDLLAKQLAQTCLRRDSAATAIPSAHPAPNLNAVDSLPSSAINPHSTFDQNAWETYLSAFKAELTDLRSHAWIRFKGQAYAVHKARVECGFIDVDYSHENGVHDPGLAAITPRTDAQSPSPQLATGAQTTDLSALTPEHAFGHWWRSMQSLMVSLEARVRSVYPPTLDGVCAERLARALAK